MKFDMNSYKEACPEDFEEKPITESNASEVETVPSHKPENEPENKPENEPENKPENEPENKPEESEE